ncbi:MAG: hypothetical protein EAX87_08525 [Candidatus Thorarchaeota archaeon]|nr:hypothetical protein [Candidatus Thorarchaeota archaeon]
MSVMNQEKSARDNALKVLNNYDKASTSIKAVLRDMQTASADYSDSFLHTHALAMSVVRFRNTIDFLISKSLTKQALQNLSIRDHNLLRLAIYEAKFLHADANDLLSFYPEIESQFLDEFVQATNFDWESAIEKMPLVNSLSLKYSYPTFLVKTLLDNLGRDETIELLTTDTHTRAYYIRPNRLYKDYETVLDELTNVKLIQDPNVPDVYRVIEGIDSIFGTQAFKDGRLIVQDKASVLTVNVLDPQPGQRIWDACAAPGMKTQFIVEKMQGIGHITASDVYEDRVKTAVGLSKKFGATQIEWACSDATKPSVHDADKILIDAPCTSTGVLQAYPSFKWRLNKETLFALMTVQNKILDAVLSDYADKPGTEVVFSTCSILPHEGESQIDSALKRHNVELLQPSDYGDQGYPGFDCSAMVTRLFPHKHESSGFFIARLRIKH